ncbi:MAG: hypothetical protein RL308_3150 [Bacteroidota bacterium]
MINKPQEYNSIIIMKEEGSKYKMIAVDHDTHKRIQTLSKSHKKTSIEFVAGMASYFSKYGLDIDSSPANVSKEIKHLNKNVIGFIRKQEELFLTPISNQVEELKTKINEVSKKLETIESTKNEKPSSTTSNTDGTLINKLNIGHINGTFNVMVALTKMLKLVPEKEKYHYGDMLQIALKIKERFENASH